MRNIKNTIEVIESISIYEEKENIKSVRVVTSNNSIFIIEYEKSLLFRVGDKLNVVINSGAK